MNRFFVEPEAINGDEAVITGEDVKHITRVLRLSKGDALILCDGAGIDYTAAILSMGEERLTLNIVSAAPSVGEPRTRVTVYQGLPKAGKMEVIVQKCVELGMDALVPVWMARSVVKPDRGFEKKRQRYQRVAYEAAKQSRRGRIPVIHGVQTVESLDLTRHELVLLAYEGEAGRTLKHVLKDQQGVRDLGLVVGPEGGFAPEEVASLTNRGAMAVTLGPRILRTETAGMAMLAMSLYEWEEGPC